MIIKCLTKNQETIIYNAYNLPMLLAHLTEKEKQSIDFVIIEGKKIDFNYFKKRSKTL